MQVVPVQDLQLVLLCKLHLVAVFQYIWVCICIWLCLLAVQFCVESESV